MNIISIIPARGGSKSIPQKNIINFCGKPLLAWSILQAIESSSVDKIYVSSDSKEILEVAKNYNALDIKRPPELAMDASPSESALLHALDQIEKSNQEKVDLVVFLQVTSPLREPEDIDGAVHKLLEFESDSLFSMSVLEDFCVWTLEGNKLKGVTFNPFNRNTRQERRPFYLENGSIYVFRPSILRKYNNRLGKKIAMFEMPQWKSYEIDTMKDVAICKYYFERELLDFWRKKESIRRTSIK